MKEYKVAEMSYTVAEMYYAILNSKNSPSLQEFEAWVVGIVDDAGYMHNQDGQDAKDCE